MRTTGKQVSRAATGALVFLVAGGCTWIQARRDEPPPPQPRSADYGRAIDGSAYRVGDGQLAESGMSAHGDRIGMAQIDTLRLEGPLAAGQVAQFLLDPSPVVCQRALEVLVEFGPAGEGALPLALQLLGSPEAEQRLLGAKALAALGSPKAESELKRAVKDPSPAVGAWARAALVSAGQACGPHLRAAAEILAEGPGRIPVEAADAMAAMACADGQARVRAAREILPAFQRDEENARLGAARAAGLLGPEAADTVPRLMGLLAQDTPPRVKQAAILALGRVGPKAAAAVPLLEQELGSRSARFRELAAHALGGIGPAARQAAGALRRAARDPEPGVQAAAQRTLKLLGAEQEEAP
jgi:hypothetical protein